MTTRNLGYWSPVCIVQMCVFVLCIWYTVCISCTCANDYKYIQSLSGTVGQYPNNINKNTTSNDMQLGKPHPGVSHNTSHALRGKVFWDTPGHDLLSRVNFPS